MAQGPGSMMEKATRDGAVLLERIGEEIRKSETRIAETLEEIENRLTFESLARATAAKGSQFLAGKVQPIVNDMGDTMKDLLEKSMDAVKRDPIPALLMGAGAGLVLFSLYKNSKKQTGADQEIEKSGGKIADAEPGKGSADRSESSGALPFGIAALVVGAVVGGIVPGVDFDNPRMKQWKAELLEKAGRAGQEILHSAEGLLRESFGPETDEEKDQDSEQA